MDEKGFLIGIANMARHVISLQALERGKVTNKGTDGCRAFITLIASVCANGQRLPPTLIYQGQSRDLQDSWIKDYDPENTPAVFATSENGWTSDELGYLWLTEVFEPRTRQSVTNGHGKRLLIVDGHSSHVNARFIEFCDAYGIVLMVFPPHSTHRLQPLDVSVFSPLSQAYSKGLNEHVQKTQGFSSVNKALFWRLFWPAWDKALNKHNIKSGFRKTGICPLDPQVVIAKIQWQPLKQTDTLLDEPGTMPQNIRELRQLTDPIRRSQVGLNPAVQRLLNIAENQSITIEILKHENANLRDTLFLEKGRKNQNKPAGLIDSDRSQNAQLYTPGKVLAMRQKRVETERLKAIEDEMRVQKKKENEMRKNLKAIELEERKKERLKKKEENIREKMQKDQKKKELQERKAAEKQLKATLHVRLKACLTPSKPAGPLLKRGKRKSVTFEDIAELDEIPQTTTKSGRVVKKRRFS